MAAEGITFWQPMRHRCGNTMLIVVQHAAQKRVVVAGQTCEMSDGVPMVKRAAEHFLSRRCAKGRPIAIEGFLRTRDYEDKDGVRRFVLEVVADTVRIFNGKVASKDGSGLIPRDRAAGEVDEAAAQLA